LREFAKYWKKLKRNFGKIRNQVNLFFHTQTTQRIRQQINLSTSNSISFNFPSKTQKTISHSFQNRCVSLKFVRLGITNTENRCLSQNAT